MGQMKTHDSRNINIYDLDTYQLSVKNTCNKNPWIIPRVHHSFILRSGITGSKFWNQINKLMNDWWTCEQGHKDVIASLDGT